MIKHRIKNFIEKAGRLNGDPHFVALGLAIGVFVAITPTMPFHTLLAVSIAVVLKASKPAAVPGVWMSNSFAVVFPSAIATRTFIFQVRKKTLKKAIE